jgi:hypothetical protein
MAERLWELFEELLKVIITVIAEAGVIDIPEFRKSEEFQYLKELFEDSFLNNQLKKRDQIKLRKWETSIIT